MSASIHPIRSKRQVKVRGHSREVSRPETFTATHINLAGYVRAKKDAEHLTACMDELATLCEDQVVRNAAYMAAHGLVSF